MERNRRRALSVLGVLLGPFRYPGGKTWLAPKIRAWLRAVARPDGSGVFVEPFGGGCVASLTAVNNGFVRCAHVREMDERVAAVWTEILKNPEPLLAKIRRFEMTTENAVAELTKRPQSAVGLAFQTIVMNRVRYGGIMADGASMLNRGENDRGVLSRWCPKTLEKRILRIHELRGKIQFAQGDGMALIAKHADNPDALFFVDPPYMLGRKKVGKRLYRHSDIDHDELFAQVAKTRGRFLMTYHESRAARKLAREHGFKITTAPMRTTRHAARRELLIVRDERDLRALRGKPAD